MKLCLNYKNPIDQLLSKQGHNYKNLPFITDSKSSQSISYCEFDKIISSVSYILHKHGIKSGNRVLIQIENKPEFLFFYFGILRLGGVVVPINPSLTFNEVENIKSSFEIDFFVTLDLSLYKLNCNKDDKFLMNFQKFSFIEVAEKANNFNLSEISICKDSTSIILCTSGTTNIPKGVELSLTSIFNNTLSICERINFKKKVIMCVLPLFHTNGQIINVFAPFLMGGKIILTPSFNLFSIATFWKDVIRYKVNIVDVVPSFLNLLIKFENKEFSFPIETLDFIICGGAPLSKEVEIVFEKKFKCTIIQEYGLTEGTCVSIASSIDIKKSGSIGKPLNCNDIKLIDDYGKDVEVNEIGEIIIRGKNVMKGYFKQKELTEKVIKNNWLHTGDIARFDELGNFYIVGRKKNIIIKGGENIYPKDIDDVLARIQTVKESITIGLPNEVFGNEIVSFVVTESNHKLSEKEIILFCKNNLPSFHCPSSIQFIDLLPKTKSGKIIQRELLALIKKNNL